MHPHTSFLLLALLAVGPCISSPVGGSDLRPTPVLLEERAADATNPPSPPVFIEPLPGKEESTTLYICPDLGPDCKSTFYDSFADFAPPGETVDSYKTPLLEQTPQAVCKDSNQDKSAWFVKQLEGWYLSEEDIHVVGSPANVTLAKHSGLPRCSDGDVEVEYMDEDYQTDYGRAPPGGCIPRTVHWKERWWLFGLDQPFSSARLDEFGPSNNYQLDLPRPLYPASHCHAFLDENCQDPASVSAGLDDAFVSASYDSEEGSQAQENFGNIKSFQCV